MQEKRASFSCMEKPVGMPQSLERRVLARLRNRKGGRVFTPTDFLDLGSRTAIDTVLSRAARAGKVRKLARGLYDLPRRNADGSLQMPATEEIVEALRGRHGIRIQPSGAHAANLLGLSEQVPVRLVFLTDGRARRVVMGKRTIVLRRATPRSLAMAGTKVGALVEALRWLGQRNVGPREMARLRRQISDVKRRQLLEAVRFAPAWIAKVLRTLANDVVA